MIMPREVHTSKHYLLLLARKISSCVRCPISLGRPANLLLETCSSFKEVRDPSAAGKVVKLKKPF